MSWLIASLLLLGLALTAGFAWYERSHPSARVLALVATLAALAALGRIAFAPVPNVKPTTDIVLLTGYALGGAPGFAVGAVAAITSNLFFGQGPWTPWQMAGWGMVGVGGAVLARTFGRDLGRVPLAAACLLAGFAYGAVMNVSLWVTWSGDHTTAALVAYFGTSLPFDIAHALGNAAFCLAFGPALVRALARFRARFEVRWRPACAGLSAGAAALALTSALALTTALPAGARASADAIATARAPGAQARAVMFATARAPGAQARAVMFATARAPGAQAPSQSVRYLLRAQNRDGGFGPAPGQRSTQLHTGWVALGLAGAGRNPAGVRRGPSVIDYMRSHARELDDLGELERTILVLRAANLSPRRFGGRNLVAELQSRRGRDGSFAGRVNTTAFAILALRAAGRSTRDRTVRGAASWIARQANRDGGYNFARRGGPSGIDDTGAALQALGAAGRAHSATARRAATFLVRRQNPDGGFPLQPGAGSNAQSTSWAIQGLLAAGRNPDRVRRGGSRSPIAYLRTLVTGSGAVRYSRTSAQTPVWVTAQALLALARKPFPLRPV